MQELPSSPFTAVQRHAGFALREHRAFLRITGADAARWLNGMVTNAAQALALGEGNYNFLLNAQGRIQGDCLLFRDPETPAEPQFLLVTDRAQLETLQQQLDRYIIMDDVELTPAFEDQTTLLLLGPEVPSLLPQLGLPALSPLHLASVAAPHGPVLLFTPPQGAVPRFELLAAPDVLAALQQALADAGIPEVPPVTLEQLRIWEGTPRFGTDIRDRELPQETGQNHALHFAKGCYLGQEIVERIRSRGQVHRVFSAFQLEGAFPSLPASLEANGKPMGELTSAVELPSEEGAKLLALGYARREVLETQTTLTYPGGTAHRRSLPRNVS